MGKEEQEDEAEESPSAKLRRLVGAVAKKLSGLAVRWKKKIAKKVNSVEDRISSLEQRIQFERLKEVVRDREPPVQQDFGDWWGIQKRQCLSHLELAGSRVVLGLLAVPVQLLGVEEDGKAKLMEQLGKRQRHLGRSRQLLESKGCAEIDRLCEMTTEWCAGLQEKKKLFNRSELRRAKKAVQQYESLAMPSLKCSCSQQKQASVVNAERLECCSFLQWYKLHSKSAEDEEERSGNKLRFVAASVVKKIFFSVKASVLAGAAIAAKVVEGYWKITVAVSSLVGAGLKLSFHLIRSLAESIGKSIEAEDGLDGQKEIFVQTGFECLVVPVKDDLSNPVSELQQKVGKHLQCRVGDFRLSYGGRDLTGGSLWCNGVLAQSTVYVLGHVLGGSPTSNEGGESPGDGDGIGASLDTSEEGTVNSGLLPEAERAIASEEGAKQSRPLSEAERKAKYRQKKGIMDKELAKRRENRKAKKSRQKGLLAKAERVIASEEGDKQSRPLSEAEQKAKYRQKKGIMDKELVLENRASFSLSEESADISFEDFERYPEAAILLHLLNSGNNKFPDLDDLDFDGDSDEWDPAVVERLLKEIQEEVPTPEELCEMLRKYCQAQGRGGVEGVDHQVEGLPKTVDAPILSCGSCGIRRPQRGSEKLAKVMLQELVGICNRVQCQ